MKKLLQKTMAVAGVSLLSLTATAAPVQRIGVDDGEPTVIYAVGWGATTGVFNLSMTADQPVKINGSTYIQYSFDRSGGTFVSKDKLVGTKGTSYGSTYAVVATSEGGSDGIWSHTYYKTSTVGGTTLNATYLANDMTYSEPDETVYGLFRSDTYDDRKLCLATYDGDTQTVTKIADLPYGTVLTAIAADGAGDLYGINGAEGKLVKIDKASGALTEVGSLGVSRTAMNQSAAIDPATNKMYWISGQSTYSTAQIMYEVNLSTGEATKLYDVAGRYSGLWIPAPPADKNAPAAPENLQAVFTGENTDVNVTFTMPSKKVGGSALSGEIDYIISVDGVETVTDKAQAGSEVVKVLSMEAGTHKISVVCSNASGNGLAAHTSVFAGYDVPKSVSALSVTVEGNKVTLTWTAPESENGGLLDASKLSYAVTRNPGAVEVASGLTDCTFTDEIPEGPLAEYSWTVTVCYEGCEDPGVTSDGVMAGDAYTVPYLQNFDALTTLGEGGYAQYNDETGNYNKSPEWTIGEADGNKFAEIAAQYYYNHSDYLFTAPLQLKKGVTYELTFKVGASGPAPIWYDWSTGTSVQKYRTFDMDVCLTTAQNVDSKYGENLLAVNYESNAENNGAFEEYSVRFSVEEDGDYSVCFYDKSNNTMMNISYRLDDISVEKIYQTPAAVSDLSAALTEEGSRDVVLTFKAPATDAEGAALAELEAIDIYRGTQLIATLTENLVPGAELSYTDEQAPRGFHAYKVAARNGEKSSAQQTVTLMVGWLNDLMVSAVTVPETVEEDATETITVTVLNNGVSEVLDYRVVLLVDEAEVDAQYGELIYSGEEKTYTFDIAWTNEASLEGTVKYQAYVEFMTDQDPDNNLSEEYPVEFAKSTLGVGDISGDEVSVSVCGGEIVVSGADRTGIAVYSLDGRTVAVSNSHGSEYSVKLAPGAYIVAVGGRSFRVVL